MNPEDLAFIKQLFTDTFPQTPENTWHQFEWKESGIVLFTLPIEDRWNVVVRLLSTDDMGVGAIYLEEDKVTKGLQGLHFDEYVIAQ